MPNQGIAPADLDTPVGLLRAALGDVNFVASNPDVAGKGDYAYWGDAELMGFLAQGRSNVTRAMGFAILQLATAANESGEVIKTDDLGITDNWRGKSHLEVAAAYFKLADQEDLDAAAADGVMYVVYPPESGWGARPLP